MITSYFAKAGKVANTVAIARRCFFYKGPFYKKLAPSKELLREYKAGRVSEKEYTKRFNRYLMSLDAEEVFRDLVDIAGIDAILLCWEGAGKFCYRHLVAAWLEEQLDISVPELEEEK